MFFHCSPLLPILVRSTSTVSLSRRHLLVATSWTAINWHRLFCSWYRTEAPCRGSQFHTDSTPLRLSAQQSGSVTSHGPTPTEHCRILTSTVASLGCIASIVTVQWTLQLYGASTPYVATGQTGSVFRDHPRRPQTARSSDLPVCQIGRTTTARAMTIPVGPIQPCLVHRALVQISPGPKLAPTHQVTWARPSLRISRLVWFAALAFIQPAQETAEL